MKNRPIIDAETGETHWLSRSIAVCAIIIARTDTDSWIFLQKRGPGCPNYRGAWSHTCGYLDGDETIQEALVREVYEEIGFDISQEGCKITEIGRNDNPWTDDLQNVTHRFIVDVPYEIFKETIDLSSAQRGGETGEVSEWTLLPVDLRIYHSLDDLGEFAFNHRFLTEEILGHSEFFQVVGESEVYNLIGKNGYVGVIPVFNENLDYRLFQVPGGRVYIEIPDLGVHQRFPDLDDRIKNRILDSVKNKRAIS